MSSQWRGQISRVEEKWRKGKKLLLIYLLYEKKKQYVGKNYFMSLSRG
jgi:hypothetical protein